MAKSNKPIVWSLFAGGGTVTAFLTPVLIFVTGLAVPLGLLERDALAYERVRAFLEHGFWKLAVFGVLFLSLWHAAHRLRITLHDFGVRADGAVAVIVYLLAAFASLAAALFLLRI